MPRLCPGSVPVLPWQRGCAGGDPWGGGGCLSLGRSDVTPSSPRLLAGQALRTPQEVPEVPGLSRRFLLHHLAWPSFGAERPDPAMGEWALGRCTGIQRM